MNIKISTLKKTIRILEEIKFISTMQHANFSQEIKKETELWRNSWIIAPLEEIIETLSEELKKYYD